MSGVPHILIATGGSGGHLFPAFAVADEIERRWPDAIVRFTTTGREIERSICATAGRQATVLPLLATSEAKRKPLRFAKALWQARRESAALLREFRPACIIGTGGFSMTPVVSAGLRQRMPVVLLEQNAVPGRATRWFSNRATAVCSSFPTLQPALGPAAIFIHSGNPVRRDIAALMDSSRDAGGPILILGGSQGARGVNHAVVWLAGHCAELLQTRGVVHQTGGSESASVATEAYRAAGIPAVVAPFFSDMADRYRQAGLVVARAGATTLAEVACAGLPAILIPYRFARDAHQSLNAASFQSAGAALVVQEDENAATTGGELQTALEQITANSTGDRLASAMRFLARPDAATQVVDVVARVIRQ